MKMKKGFTLIEILVVVTIFGLLAAMIIVSVSNVSAKRRDAQRISSVNQIFRALAIYQSQNQRYPYPFANYINLTGSDDVSNALENAGTISQVLPDPLAGYTYTYTSADGTTFTLGFCLETNTVQGYSQGCGNTISP